VTLEIAYVLLVAVVALALFGKNVFPAETIALGILVALVAGGALTPEQAFAAFGNEALATVCAMFVLSAALVRTGAVAFIGRRILAVGGKSEWRVLITVMLSAAACSSFINNTPVAVIFVPIVLGVAEVSGLHASKLLLPMSYATIVGGMSTIVGTSTNVLVSSMLPRFGFAPLDFFEPLPLALIGLALTVAYMTLVGRRFLPERDTLTSRVSGGEIREYVTELSIPDGSPLAGKSLREAVLERAPQALVLQVIRGEEILSPDPRRVLRAGDALIVKGDVNALLALQRRQGVELSSELAAPALEARPRNLTLVELLVRPASAAIGERVGELELRARHGAAVIAVQRAGIHLREKVADLRLRFGDVLLVEADAAALAHLHAAPEFIVLEGVNERVMLTHKAWMALTTIAAVVALAVVQVPVLPISVLAVSGALALLACGCIGVREAYRSVDLSIVFLIGGTIALGSALEASGAAELVARGIVRLVEPLGALAMLSAIYLIANATTALVSNTSAAVLMLPIAISTARQAGLDPTPFVIAVLFAASIDFSTPFGYQTNTFVYGPGGYRFLDYVRVGGPLNLMWWALATAAIPCFWPLSAAP
jgi:di/tricarboxylate transporter